MQVEYRRAQAATIPTSVRCGKPKQDLQAFIANSRYFNIIIIVYSESQFFNFLTFSTISYVFTFTKCFRMIQKSPSPVLKWCL